MKLRHVDLLTTPNSVYQDARGVKTKFRKTFRTYFFPAGEQVHQIVVDWVRHLQQELLWGNDDPLFPATLTVVGTERQFQASGLKRQHWTTAAPIRAIFQKAFANAGMPYFNPHSFRNTLAQLGEVLCRNAEDFKAWSQNLGHERVLTTFYSYGAVSVVRQAEIIRSLGAPQYEHSATWVTPTLWPSKT